MKLITFRILFTIITFFDLDINQINIKTIFFYGFINQFIYIKILKGTKLEKNQNIVCKLLKDFYDFQ